MRRFFTLFPAGSQMTRDEISLKGSRRAETSKIYLFFPPLLALANDTLAV